MEKADIYWSKNRIAFGEDDPHKGTPSEGFHATLKIGGHFLRVPEYQYTADTANLLKDIKEKLNKED